MQIVKPFEKEELIARIEAMIRRNNRTYIKNELIFENMKLDLSSRKAYIENKEITLQGKQFDMLEYLINYKDKIITKEQIFDKIWGFNSETTTNVVEVYARNKRKKYKKTALLKFSAVFFLWLLKREAAFISFL